MTMRWCPVHHKQGSRVQWCMLTTRTCLHIAQLCTWHTTNPAILYYITLPSPPLPSPPLPSPPLPLSQPGPPAVSLFLVAAATGVVVVLVTLAVTIPLTVCITLWCKKRCGKGRDRLGRNTQTREYHKGDVGIVNDAEGEVEGSSDEKSALLHHEEH